MHSKFSLLCLQALVLFSSWTSWSQHGGLGSMFETILHCHLVVVEITLGCWFEWHCHTASVISYHIHVVLLFYVAGWFFFLFQIYIKTSITAGASQQVTMTDCCIKETVHPRKIHVFSLTCGAIYQSRLFYCELPVVEDTSHRDVSQEIMTWLLKMKLLTTGSVNYLE